MKSRTSSKTDFTRTALPHNRREVFSDICAMYGGMLFKLGLILVIFAVPCLFVGFMADQNELAYLAEAVEGADRAALYREYQVTDSLFSLVNVVGFMIFSVGLAGAARILRQHAWEEPVNLKIDFLRGIRQNARPYLMLGFLAGCWIFFAKYCFAGALYSRGGAVIVNILPLLLGLLVLLPTLGVTLVATTIYTNPLRRNLRLGLWLFLKKPLPAIGICLGAILPLLAAQAIVSIPIRLLLRLLNVVLAPFLLLLWFLWCMNVMDKYINSRDYPELVGKGFVPKEETENKSEP